MEFELEVTVNSMGNRTDLHYFSDLNIGFAYVARRYGHFDQVSIVVTRIYHPDDRKEAPKP